MVSIRNFLKISAGECLADNMTRMFIQNNGDSPIYVSWLNNITRQSYLDGEMEKRNKLALTFMKILLAHYDGEGDDMIEKSYYLADKFIKHGENYGHELATSESRDGRGQEETQAGDGDGSNNKSLSREILYGRVGEESAHQE